MRVRFGVLMLLACAPVMADLAQIRAEPNLEKRAHGALDNAERALKASRKAYEGGDLQQTQALLDEVKDSVSLAEESLNATGKNPIKSPRHFKYAEIKTEDLLRKLDSLSRDMNVADRPMADPVKAKLLEVHDSLLQGIMMGKKK